jgi:hypothetical protein
MSTIDLFRKLTLTEVSQKLQLKPFDIARIMGQNGGLPDVLLFSDELVDQIRKLAGVEVWWDAEPLAIEDENRSRALVRTLSQKLQAHEKGGGGSTRADNLFRGLEGADQLLIRRAVNQFIREGLLLSLPTARGLYVQIDTVQRDTLDSITNGSDIPDSIEALWT